MNYNQSMRFYLPFCKSIEFMSYKIMLFQKHVNSKVQKPPFFADVNYNNYYHKQWTLKHRNTQNGWRSTNHRSQTMTVWTSLSKVLGSKKCKCQLPFELQSSHVFERLSNFNYLLLGAENSFKKKNVQHLLFVTILIVQIFLC